MKHRIVAIITKVPVYLKNGYFSLGIEYLKDHGCKETLIKVRQVIFGEPRSLPSYVKNYSEDGNKFHNSKVESHQETVDIIICVHNALEDVKLCIESVIKHTNDPYRIILVNDGSDEMTASYLKNISLQYTEEKIVLLTNIREQHGYAIAANIGMNFSTGEFVVLLNSDTIVTEGWIDKMIDCAKSDSQIGIVGPLSNTAGWQSVPELMMDGDWCHNELPEGINIQKMGAIIEKYSGKIYIQVPLINGFCMMISRRVFEKIGYFDEENFGRGFGEEDDFNLRAYGAGFKLAVADNTFIYHAQSKSYTDAVRKELSKKSRKILREKHGGLHLDECVVYMRENLVFLGIRRRIAASIVREQLLQKIKDNWEGKRILFHLPCSEAGGGANVIIQECYKLQEMGIVIAFYNLEMYQGSFERGYPDLKIPVYYGVGYNGFLKYAAEFDMVCITYYKAVQYVKTIVNDRNEKIKYAYYIQDFEPFFFEEGSKAYREALRSYTEIPDMICVTKTNWNYNIVKEKTGRDCAVLGPSVNLDLFRPRRAFTNRHKVTMAAMVRRSPRRAPLLTLQVLKKLKDNYGDKIEIVIFGCEQEEYAELKRKIAIDFACHVCGKTTPEQTAAILSNSDIFVDYSEFQAMGLTAMEAMASGCAVVVPQNGGTGDFAKHEINCLVVNTHEIEECIKQTSRLIDDWDLRNRLTNRAVCDICEFIPEKCVFRFMEQAFGNDIAF